MKKIGKPLFAIMVLVALLFLLASCEHTQAIDDENTSDRPGANQVKISALQAEERMIEDVIILDVRTQDEFDAGHIKNAILLPYDETMTLASSILHDKNQTILIYCRTGRRSAIAATLLIELGYTSVYDFGGIEDWHGEVIVP